MSNYPYLKVMTGYTLIGAPLAALFLAGVAIVMFDGVADELPQALQRAMGLWLMLSLLAMPPATMTGLLVCWLKLTKGFIRTFIAGMAGAFIITIWALTALWVFDLLGRDLSKMLPLSLVMMGLGGLVSAMLDFLLPLKKHAIDVHDINQSGDNKNAIKSK